MGRRKYGFLEVLFIIEELFVFKGNFMVLIIRCIDDRYLKEFLWFYGVELIGFYILKLWGIVFISYGVLYIRVRMVLE